LVAFLDGNFVSSKKQQNNQGEIMHTRVETTFVGYVSWSTGFVPCATNFFDELRADPLAVFNRLCNLEEWDLAEWVLDNFL